MKDKPWDSEMSVSIRGYELNVHAMGTSGDAFVLVPGIGVSKRYFLPLAEELSRRGRVYLMELPGFSDTREPKHGLTIAEFAALVLDALRVLGIGGALWVGHSMGSQVVTEMALLDPASSRGLVLLAPTINSRERRPWIQALRLFQDSLREPPAVNIIVLTDYLRCGLRWYLKTLPQMLGQRLEERIRNVVLPVLIVRGARDPIVPDYWLRELSEACPTASTAEVAGESHVMMYRRADVVAGHCLAMAGIR